MLVTFRSVILAPIGDKDRVVETVVEALEELRHILSGEGF